MINTWDGGTPFLLRLPRTANVSAFGRPPSHPTNGPFNRPRDANWARESAMTDTTWTGNLNSDYSNPTNWNNAVPTGSNNGVFDANGKHQSTILVGSALEFAGGWIFNGGAYTITVSVTEVIFQGLGVQVNAGIPNINVTSNSTLLFQNNSDGGGAAYSLGNNNIIDFHGDANSKVSLGSINAVFGSTIH